MFYSLLRGVLPRILGYKPLAAIKTLLSRTKFNLERLTDPNVDKYFMIGSSLKTDRTIEWQDGKTYPYFTLDVSSESHPYYTGKQRVIQKEGRVANYNRRFAQFTKE